MSRGQPQSSALLRTYRCTHALSVALSFSTFGPETTKAFRKRPLYSTMFMAPRPGLEPGTCGLTVRILKCIAALIKPHFSGRDCQIFLAYILPVYVIPAGHSLLLFGTFSVFKLSSGPCLKSLYRASEP
jgi:hypothetical protein